MKINLTIDGKPISAKEGQMLVDAAADNGVYIPTLCHTRGQPCIGTCRVCSVKVNQRVEAACTVPVAADMQVQTQDPDVVQMRKELVEMLFAEGNHNCPSCEKSGHCDLQAVGYEVGMMASQFPYRFTPHESDSAAQKIWLERDRCIFCQRCVELVRDPASGEKIFAICGRGSTAKIVIDHDLANKMSDEEAKAAAQLCPVGAILQKNQAFHDPIGQRKFDTASVRERVLRGETV